MAFQDEQIYSQNGGQVAIRKQLKLIHQLVKEISPGEDSFGEQLSFWSVKGYMYQGHIVTRVIGAAGSCPVHTQSLVGQLPVCIAPHYSLNLLNEQITLIDLVGQLTRTLVKVQCDSTIIKESSTC